MIRIGQIGAGFMGNTHSAAYSILCKEMDIKLCAVADIRRDVAEAVATKHGAVVYENPDELIASPDIDVVDLCIPTYLHAKYAKAAMEAGKNVFIEKPVTLTPEEGEELLAVQARTGAKVQVGQCIRLWPAYIYLKEVYDDKRFGALRHLTMRRQSSYPVWAWNDWFTDYDNKSGGAALDLHIHDVDYMRYLLGEPEWMATSGDRGQAFGQYRYPGNVTVTLEGGWEYPGTFPFAMMYKARFEKAAITFENNVLTVYPDEGEPFVVEDPNANQKGEDLGGNLSDLGGYYNELKYFYNCLLTGEEITVAPLIEGVKSVKLIQKIVAGFGR